MKLFSDLLGRGGAENILRCENKVWDGVDDQCSQVLFYNESKLIAIFNKSYSVLTIL